MGPVDAADLLGMAKDGITFLAEKKQATVEVSVDKDVPVVLSDEEKLRRVVENLVSNAVKFIDAGGHVRLKGSYDFTARALSLGGFRRTGAASRRKTCRTCSTASPGETRRQTSSTAATAAAGWGLPWSRTWSNCWAALFP